MSDYARAADVPAVEQAGKAKFEPDYAVPPQLLLRRGATPEKGWVRYDADDKVANGFTIVIRK